MSITAIILSILNHFFSSKGGMKSWLEKERIKNDKGKYHSLSYYFIYSRSFNLSYFYCFFDKFIGAQI